MSPEEIRVAPDDWEAAVADAGGPQLVVAGPGTGKTEFLVRRAAHLISTTVDRADRVLLLTFSRRAATDLRRRVGDLVPGSVNRVAASTFHSFAHRLLEATEGTAPALLTGPEQLAVVADLLEGEDPAAWPVTLRPLLGSHTLARDVTDFLLRAAERLIGSDRLEELAAARPEWRALPAFARRYQAALERAGRIDYGTLLARAVDRAGDVEVAGRLASAHPYVIIDEWQDTSPAQVELTDLLTRAHRNVTVAGDPYQSVYSFRGAELSNVAEFPDRFRGLDGSPARRLVLTTSFRVPVPVLDGALRVTSSGELPGAAGPVAPADHRGSVEAYVFDQASAEAEWIAGEVERLHLVDGLPYSRMAVLVRSKRRLLPELSRALDRRRVPHDQPDTRLVDHPAVQVVFDLARAAARGPSAGSTAEEDLLARRIVLGPLLRAPLGQERDLLRRRRREGTPWPSLIAEHLGPEGEAVGALMSDPDWASRLPAVEGFWSMWERLPQVERIVTDPTAADHRAAWAAFAQALERQAERDPELTLVDYWRMTAADDFEATPLLGHPAPAGDRLTLTTLHQAKGLEFDVVILADAVEGAFPDLRRGVSLLQTHALNPGVGASAADHRRFRLQEEMRLAYTAMTRARHRVVWTATSAGIDEGERRPSRFMLAAAGVDSADRLPPPEAGGDPITARQAVALLRRVLVDPSTPAPRRLAAAAVLAHPPLPLWDARRFAGICPPGPDRGVLPDAITLSPSQAEAYAACPRSYVFERRLGVGDVTSASARFGSLVHAALERAERLAMAAGRDRARLDEALDALEAVWADEADFGSAALDLRWRLKAEEAVTRLYREWPSDSAGAVDLERPLEAEIGGRRWVGRADRIERTTAGHLRVVDYKTTTQEATFPEAAESLQLGFYLLASRRDPELATAGPTGEAELWYPRSRAKSWRRPFQPERVDGVEAALTEIAGAIVDEDWRPTPGPACRWCRVRLVCPVWPDGREAYGT